MGRGQSKVCVPADLEGMVGNSDQDLKRRFRNSLEFANTLLDPNFQLNCVAFLYAVFAFLVLVILIHGENFNIGLS